MGTHGHDFWNDCLICPLDTEYLSELLEIVRRSFTDRKYGITQPAHAESGQFLIKEFDAKLACQERNVLDNCQPNSPLFIFGELHDRGEEGL